MMEAKQWPVLVKGFAWCSLIIGGAAALVLMRWAEWRDPFNRVDSVIFFSSTGIALAGIGFLLRQGWARWLWIASMIMLCGFLSLVFLMWAVYGAILTWVLPVVLLCDAVLLLGSWFLTRTQVKTFFRSK